LYLSYSNNVMMGTENWNDIYIIYELKTNALIHISYKSNL